MALALKVKVDYNHVLSKGIEARARALTATVASAQRASIGVAQSTSLALIQRQRPGAEPRFNRDQESITKVLKWGRTSRGASQSGVGLNLDALNTRSKHWIIQEIGTGQRATQRVADRANPVGRPAAGATYIKSVPAQTGRRISASLVWATGPGGDFVPSGGGAGQQLYLRKMIKFPEGVGGAAYGNAFKGRSQPGIIIRHEIEPRHFVQAGGQAGFRLYRGSVLSAARQQFRKSR